MLLLLLNLLFLPDVSSSALPPACVRAMVRGRCQFAPLVWPHAQHCAAAAGAAGRLQLPRDGNYSTVVLDA